MAVKLGAKNVQSEDDLGGNRPLPGRYHVMVQHADDSMEKMDKVIVEFQVLAGTTPGQEGKTATEMFALTDKAIQRLQRLAMCTGLLKPGDEDHEIDFAAAEGRQLVIELAERSYEKDGQKKTIVALTFNGMWSLNNQAVADVPKNLDAIRLMQESGQKTNAGNDGDPKPVPASVGDDKWADL